MNDTGAESRNVPKNKRIIDFGAIAEYIGKYMIAILLLSAAVGILTFVHTSKKQQATYTSNATVAVTNIDYRTNVDVNEMIGTVLDVTGKLKNTAGSFGFKDAVAAELGYPVFGGTATVTGVGTSNMIRISVVSEDPEVSYLEVRALCDNLKKYAANLSGGANITVVEQPMLQENPTLSKVGLKKPLIAALAVFAVLCFLLAGISMARDYVSDGMDVVSKVGTDFLGAIFRNKKGKARTDLLITDPEADLRYTEEIRRLAIRTGRRMSEKGLKVLLVASAASGEGKSAAAANIAAALAQMGRKTALVEMDHSAAARKTAPDLQGMQNIENLTVIPATECREADEMKAVLAKASDNADYVIIDAAPVNESSDAAELSKLADTILLVIRRRCTEIPEIRKAIVDLGGQDKILGSVVSDVRRYNERVSVSECAALKEGGSGKYLIDRGNKEELEIDLAPFLGELGREIGRYGLVILAVVALFAGCFYYFGSRGGSVKYVSHVFFTAEPQQPVLYKSYNDTNNSSTLVGKILPSILSSDAMKSVIKEDLGFKQSQNLPVTITAVSENNTNFIRVSVAGSDAEAVTAVLHSLIRKSPVLTDVALGSLLVNYVEQTEEPIKNVARPDGKKPGLAGALLGLILCLAVLIGKLIGRDAVLDEDEITWRLRTECLGRIPWINSRKMKGNAEKPLTIDSGEVPEQFAESVRVLRCRIEKEAQENGTKSFLVTSAAEAEGKTTSAVNLALSLAGSGHKVLLVDGDLRKPSVMKALGMEPAQTGLTDILAGKCAVEKVLVPYKDLTILPAGEAVDVPSTLWSSGSAGELLKELRDQYDFVIIDAPRSAVVSETALLAEMADACIYIIRRSGAGFDELCEGVETFEESDCKFLGCVMRS